MCAHDLETGEAHDRPGEPGERAIPERVDLTGRGHEGEPHWAWKRLNFNSPPRNPGAGIFIMWKNE